MTKRKIFLASAIAVLSFASVPLAGAQTYAGAEAAVGQVPLAVTGIRLLFWILSGASLSGLGYSLWRRK